MVFRVNWDQGETQTLLRQPLHHQQHECFGHHSTDEYDAVAAVVDEEP